MKELVAQRGLVKVVAEFSGGNDSGGFDRVTGVDDQGREHPIDYKPSHEHLQTDTGGWRTIQRLRQPGEALDEQLRECLYEPLGEAYGGWAWDFYTQGQITIDLTQPEGSEASFEEDFHEPEYDDEDEDDDEGDSDETCGSAGEAQGPEHADQGAGG